MSLQKSLKSPKFAEYRKRRRRALRIKIFFILLIFSIVLASVSFITRMDEFKISAVKVSGNRLTDVEDVEKLIGKNISGNYLYIFAKDNSFIYPAKKIKKELLNTFKRLTEVSLDVKDKVLSVEVKERNQKYIWCNDGLVIDETANDNCYFLDNDGYIFDFSPYFSDGVYFKFSGARPSELDPIGSHFLPENFKQLILFKEAMELMKLNIISLRAEENGDMKMFLSSGAYIIFKSKDDFSKLAENLQSALSTEPLQTDFVKKYDSLLYIDLRFGNKVYYKFR